MRSLQVSLFALVALVGCDSVNNVKVDNPVMGPPPPRLAVSEDRPGSAAQSDEISISNADVAQSDRVRPISHTIEIGHQKDDLFGSRVVAMVNGEPILSHELLDRYAAQLAEGRQKMSAEDFQRIRKLLIQRDLKSHIERKLLVQSLRSRLQKEQLDKLEEHLDRLFEEEIARLKKELKVNTKHELEIELKKRKTSLAFLRDQFSNQRMAMEYLASKAQTAGQIDRKDMLHYYESHRDEYTVPAKVRWQQLLVSYAIHGGKQSALTVLEKAIDELRNGQDFADVVRRYSDGPTAARGGQWSWTEIGSLADSKLEKALAELPVGTISQVFESDDSFRLVKVNERKPAGRVSFKKVQDEIKEILQKQVQREATRKVLEELYQNAIVETLYDDMPQGSRK